MRQAFWLLIDALELDHIAVIWALLAGRRAVLFGEVMPDAAAEISHSAEFFATAPMRDVVNLERNADEAHFQRWRAAHFAREADGSDALHSLRAAVFVHGHQDSVTLGAV